jgi:hypothetical protein
VTILGIVNPIVGDVKKLVGKIEKVRRFVDALTLFPPKCQTL